MSNPDTTEINMERLVIMGGAFIILGFLYKYILNRKISILEFVLFIILVFFAIEKFNRKRPALASLIKDSIEKI
jgi:uncharacterized membrane protein